MSQGARIITSGSSVIKSQTETEWESGFTVYTKKRVLIPISVIKTLKAIGKKLDGEEYCIVGNVENGIMSEDIYIPKQEVSSAAIDIKEPVEGYNTIIHRHPKGLDTFSQTDWDYINKNFEYSMLYLLEKGVVGGVTQIKEQGTGDRFYIDLVIETLEEALYPVDINNIEMKYKTYARGRYNYDDGQYGLGYTEPEGKSKRNKWNDPLTYDYGYDYDYWEGVDSKSGKRKEKKTPLYEDERDLVDSATWDTELDKELDAAIEQERKKDEKKAEEYDKWAKENDRRIESAWEESERKKNGSKMKRLLDKAMNKDVNKDIEKDNGRSIH